MKKPSDIFLIIFFTIIFYIMYQIVNIEGMIAMGLGIIVVSLINIEKNIK